MSSFTNPSPTDFRTDLFAHAQGLGQSFEAARGTLLLAPRSPAAPLFFFEHGTAHAFIDVASGRQTLRLGYPGEMLSSLPSLFLGVPTDIGIEALRRCVGVQLSRKQLEAFLAADPARSLAYISMLEAFACGLMERELDLLEPSPRKRYEKVLKRSPQVFQEVPLRYIASYLRMTPETLSRVRQESTKLATPH